MKHTKRYMVVVRTKFGKEPKYIGDPYVPFVQEDSEEFDTIKDARNFIGEYEELYKGDEKPILVESVYVNKQTGARKRYLNKYWAPYDNDDDWRYIAEWIDYSGGKRWWAYVIADFEEERIIKTGGDKGLFIGLTRPGIRHGKINDTASVPPKLKVSLESSLAAKDYFFRAPDEIPEDYAWDGDEEYIGWLQYRWGNGKNSVTYIEPGKERVKCDYTGVASDNDLKKWVSNYDEPEYEDVQDAIDNIEEKYIKDDIKEYKNKRIY